MAVRSDYWSFGLKLATVAFSLRWIEILHFQHPVCDQQSRLVGSFICSKSVARPRFGPKKDLRATLIATFRVELGCTVWLRRRR